MERLSGGPFRCGDRRPQPWVVCSCRVYRGPQALQAISVSPRSPNRTGALTERAAGERIAHGRSPFLGSGQVVSDFLRQAMNWYEQAEAVRPAGNDDAVIRWNACVRMLQRQAQQGAGSEIM